jgi:hypothetical protein
MFSGYKDIFQLDVLILNVWKKLWFQWNAHMITWGFCISNFGHTKSKWTTVSINEIFRGRSAVSVQSRTPVFEIKTLDFCFIFMLPPEKILTLLVTVKAGLT